MKSLADALPPEIAQQIHPDWRKNEEDYQSSRYGLLDQYRGQWIAFDNGTVIAAASTPLDVFLAVQDSGRHPFVIRVGHEDEPWYHIRRALFAYDSTYPPTALPVLSAEFRSSSGINRFTLGSRYPGHRCRYDDATLGRLPTSKLKPSRGILGVISGVAGGRAVTIGFLIWVWLDGQEYPCQLQADFGGRERILGRDVLNRLEILFRGPSGEVVVNP